MATPEIAALGLGAVACWCDLRTRRIPNLLTFGGAAAALVYAFASHGPWGLAGSVGGWFTAALLFAPLSIVQAIGSTTTLFVFLIGVLLTLTFPRFSQENLSAREIVAKGAAAVLVAAGVTLVNQ